MSLWTLCVNWYLFTVSGLWKWSPLHSHCTEQRISDLRIWPNRCRWKDLLSHFLIYSCRSASGLNYEFDLTDAPWKRLIISFSCWWLCTKYWCIVTELISPFMCLISLEATYAQISNISQTLVGNKIVDHSDVVGALPVGTNPTTHWFSTSHLVFNGLGKDNCKAKWETFKIWNVVCLILKVSW